MDVWMALRRRDMTAVYPAGASMLTQCCVVAEQPAWACRTDLVVGSY